MKLYVSEKTAEGQTYYYCHIGSERHGRPTYIMWVSKSLLKSDEQGRLYLEFPVPHCDIKQGKKESTIILKHGGLNLYKFTIECGYRGESHIDEIITEEPDQTQSFYFYEYASETGSLGVSQGALILTRSLKVKIKWHRSGRLYGKPASGITVLYGDGRVEQLPEVEKEDLAELQEEEI
jgi:hypothetical protein